MPKRGHKVPRPASGKDWDIIPDTREAGEAWDQQLTSHGNALAEAWDLLTRNPRQRTERNHQLRGDLGYRSRGGLPLEQWQYEFSGPGRIWYCIDDDNHTVWLTEVRSGHPGQTDTRRRRKG